jgi:hypothetical protein
LARLPRCTFLTDVFGAERPCLTGAADFEAALGQVLRKWGSTVSVEVALRVWTLDTGRTLTICCIHANLGLPSRAPSTSHPLWRRSRLSHRKCFSLMIMRRTSRLPEVAVYTQTGFIFPKAWGESMRFSKGMALMFPIKALELIGAASTPRPVELRQRVRCAISVDRGAKKCLGIRSM